MEIAAAPSAPEPERGWLSALLPGLSALGMLGFALLSPNVLIIAICGSVAVLSAVAAVWSTRHQRRRRDQLWKARRERYVRHLATCVRVLNEAELRQRDYAVAAHPSPDGAAAGAAGGRLWDRRPTDADFFRIRLGLGSSPARRPPRVHNAQGDPDGEPDLLALAADVVARHGALDDIPLTVDLAEHATTVISFDQLTMLRAAIVSLVTSHGPDVLRLHALAPPAELEWLGMLPQAACLSVDSAALVSSLRTLGSEGTGHSIRDVVVLAGDEVTTRAALSGLSLSQTKDAGSPITTLALLAGGRDIPAQVSLTVRSDPDGGAVVSAPGETPRAMGIARADGVTHAQALDFADAVRLFRMASTDPAATNAPVLLEALLAADPVDPLRIPIGRDDEGAPATVDLREAARNGDGPHGLVIGATGTGKSELLRSLVIAAAHQSSPADLALLLVDYKGGAAFSDLARLPHSAGLVTNLNSDRHGIERLCASLRAELRRRQSTLRDAGADDIDAYRIRAKSRMPRLLVVVDEYAELIEESPDMLDVLMSLGRLGRSLGIHLLLASQRLDDGRLRGLDAHLRFRICLRTSSASESVAVLGSPVAVELPSAPGWAWLRRDGVLTRLRVAWVPEPALAVDGVSDRHDDPARDPGWSMPPVCLPPLPDVLAHTGSAPARSAGVGLLDLPELGEQRPLIIDLTDPAAHLAIAGAPRSGRSTALATLVTALAADTPPRELAIHIVTSATSLLAGTAGLPHVGTVATSGELTGRVIRAVADTVAERHAEVGFERAEAGHLLLVIDDVSAAVDSDDALAECLNRIATAGLSVGVSLALSCGRWSELRGALREAIGTRWELRLNDPAESLFPQLTRGMRQIPAGRILTGDGHWAQVALPPAAGGATADRLPEALAELISTIARRGGRATRPIQLLPSRVPATALPAPSRRGRLPLAVGGTYGEPVELALAPGEHLIVLGNAASGRSGLLRSVAGFAADEGAALWLIDPRRSLTRSGVHPQRRASGPPQTARLVEELVLHLEAKPARSRTQDVLIIDDLELAAGRFGTAPFGPLAELLPFAADLGLSVVVARRVSGSSRAAFDPFFGRLLELCDTCVLLSGDPSEGPVVGGLRPRVRPPGRGQLVVRGEPAGEVQTAWAEPDPTSHLPTYT